MELLLYSEPFPIKDAKEKFSYNRKFEGIARKLENAIANRADDEVDDSEKNAYSRYFVYSNCDKCNGTRLNQRAESVKINDKSIGEIGKMELSEVLIFFQNINDEISNPILRKAKFVLEHLINIGVGYLSLDGPVSTLSGGESQRVKMAMYLDSDESSKGLFIFDEPTTGLHIDDISKLITCFRNLIKNGNSVIIIEHNLHIISNADWITDLGPEAGENGGQVVATGNVPAIMNNPNSLTGKAIKDFLEERKIELKAKPSDDLSGISKSKYFQLKMQQMEKMNNDKGSKKEKLQQNIIDPNQVDLFDH